MNVERADTFIASLGFEAYRVGGSVRDELLGRKVKDADYMIRGVPMRDLGIAIFESQRPDEAIRKLTPLKLRDERQAGWRVFSKDFGLVEIVLPRTEVPRAPKLGESTHRAFDIVVDENVSLAEDAKRRDFTFNALYKYISPHWDGTQTTEDVVDPTGRGLYDLSHKLISTTHETSFRDDPLRTLRALRFMATLGYDLGSATEQQMRDHAHAVTGLSAKGYASGTVLEELSKLLMGEAAVAALRMMRDTGVMAVLFPGLAPMIGYDQGSRYHDLTTDEHTFKALERAVHVDAPLRVRMALLFHDAGKPATAWVGEDGRKHYYAQKMEPGEGMVNEFDGHINIDHEEESEHIWRETATWMGGHAQLVKEVATLIRHHMVTTSGRKIKSRVARMRIEFGDDLLRDLFLHRLCDLCGKDTGVNAKFIEYVGEMEKLRHQMASDDVPCSLKSLKINGKDCIELGLVGRDIGRVLNTVLDEVAVDPTEDKRGREWQISRAEALA